jgi:hypothetical protein
MTHYRRREYRRWFLAFLFISVGVLSLTAFFNHLVDGHGLFTIHRGLGFAATNLVNGGMVAGPLGGHEERELNRLVIEKYPRQRDIITIGSSRNMQVRKRFFPGNPDFFNHSMAAAGLEDYLAIVNLYRRRAVLPKTVVLGIDPWIFNKNLVITPWWQGLAPFYKELAEEISGKQVKVSVAESARYLQLINLDYTAANWKLLRAGRKLYTTENIGIDDFVREPDGSIHFPYKIRLHRDRRKQPYPAHVIPTGYLQNFTSIANMELFKGFVSFLKGQGVEVVFLLLPFHPVLHRLIMENPQCRTVITTEMMLRDFGKEQGVPVVGSFDPTGYALKDEDFSDDIHGHEIVAQRVLGGYR